MTVKNQSIIFFVLFLNFFSLKVLCSGKIDNNKTLVADNLPVSSAATVNPINSISKKEIKEILVEGNKNIKTEVIKNKLPYKIGDLFDPALTGEAISNLYNLKYFKQVKIEVEPQDDKKIKLYVIVSENPQLDKYEFIGNKAIKKKKIVEKLALDKVETVDETYVSLACEAIKKMYKEEGYFFADVTGKLVPSKSSKDKVDLIFNISEKVNSKVLQVSFVGNNHFLSNKLRKIVFTKENWILAKLSGAGKYIPEAIEYDKGLLERFYQDHGYLLAKISDVKVDFSEDKRDVSITYFIEEGKRFKISKVSAPGDDVLVEDDILSHVLIEQGGYYNATNVARSVERLKDLWGEKGYINADVYPQLTPNEENNTVEVIFYAEKGDKVFVRRIEITGNDVTNDRVIRHKIGIEEGDLLTTKKLMQSSDDIERLSFFDKGGVNWRMHRINDELVDLEMNVKETKTGHAGLNASLGSGDDSNKRALKVGAVLEKRNFMGEGYDVGAQAQIQLSRRGSQAFEGHFVNPHLYDSDVAFKVEGYHKKQEFDEWSHLRNVPYVRESGGIFGLGFDLDKLATNLNADFEIGCENLATRKDLDIRGTIQQIKALKMITDNTFKASVLQWFGVNFVKDTRNHIMYPNKGYKVAWFNKVAFPGLNKNYSYFKTELDVSWYTALIGEDALVLMLHGKVGSVLPIGQEKAIPYKELFNMGGQSTVRGFTFGSIGPAWQNQDPLGAKNAVLFNTELIFPLIPDMSIKGHVFYDAGAGWSTPKYGTTMPSLITRNTFNFRQSVGFGLNITAPQPMKIDWGYKLDRNKAAGESPSEFHLSANFAF